MSSLNRVLSLECTDIIPSPLLSSRPKIARHSSLPTLSFYTSQGLPSLASPTSTFHQALHGTCRHNVPLSPPSCGFKPENAPHQFASVRSAPAWFADDEVDSGRRTIARSISRKEGLDVGDSVVYKELCDSIRHLEVPCRYVCDLRSEGMPGSATTHDVGQLCEQTTKKKGVEPSSNDVRGRPLSLCMLKRRVTPKPEVRVSFKSSYTEEGLVVGGCTPQVTSSRICDSSLCDVGGPVTSAFSSIFFMMEALQQHTLWLRRILMSEADARLHEMMAKVHQEMQDTFLWLFEKVFSCTPKLMLLTMMLLVDFAVHSMGEHVALAIIPPMGEPPTCAIERGVTTKSTSFGRFDPDGSSISVANAIAMKLDTVQGSLVEPRLCEGGAGDGCVRTLKVGGSMDEEAMQGTFADWAAMMAEDDSHGRVNDAFICGHCTVDDDEGFFKSGAGSSNGGRVGNRHKLTSMWQQATMTGPTNPRHRTKTRHMLVAPAQAPTLEADDYPCFDRTDLTYQHELSRDPSNPLLLANYAQFLHVVRHDHDRAEEVYKRAVKADPVDGEVMGKYASFLWVAKEDTEGADEAYKAAMVADPSNAYCAGSYAHFLWNSSASQDDTTLTGEDDTTLAATSYQHVSTAWQ